MKKTPDRKLDSHKISSILLALLLASFAPALLIAAPSAHAATSLSTWCSGNGGASSYSGSTCTVTGAVTMSGNVEVLSGETLVINGSGEITVNSGVVLSVSPGGTMSVENSNATTYLGIDNSGTIANSGTITISNSGITTGIFNDLASGAGISNLGSITVQNTGYIGIHINEVLTNFGNITVENSGGSNIGIFSSGTLDNFGAITVENSGGTGIITAYPSTTTNSGTVTVENSGGYGIIGGDDISNAGTVTVENSGGTGIWMTGTNITNSGSVYLYSIPGLLFDSPGTLTGGAVYYALDSATCTSLLGGGWSGTTCTVSSSVTFSGAFSGFTAGLYVPSGATLDISSNYSGTGNPIGIDSKVPISNSGTITVENSSPADGFGILAEGNLYNAGTLNVENSGISLGIDNIATIYNSGTMTILNSGTTGSTGVGTDPGGVGIVNTGTITVENSGYIGIRNGAGTLTNTGTITVENSVGNNIGIYDTAAISNSGTITVENSAGTGIGGFAGLGTITNAGTLTVENTGGDGLTALTITNPGTIYNLGTIQSPLGEEVSIDNTGTVENGCGGVFSASLTGNPLVQDTNCANYAGITSALSTLQTDLSSNLATGLGGISTELTGITSLLGTLQTSVNDLTVSLSTLSSNLATDTTSIQTSISNTLSTLSSAIASIGSSGPLTGTSNDATVFSASLSSVAGFSSSPSDWTPVVAPGTLTSQSVVSGVSVSPTKGSITQGVLLISVTNTPGGQSSTYAVNLGDLPNGVSPANVQLRFPFSIPAGSAVYVQLLSSSKSGADVQLQFVGLPILAPTVTTST